MLGYSAICEELKALTLVCHVICFRRCTKRNVVGKAKVDLEILINVPNKHSSIHSLPFAKDKSRHNDDKTFKSKPLCYLLKL